MSQAVLKATDGTLTTDDWQRIMTVCDLVREDPEDNGSLVMQLIERRLEQKDANVILRTLSLVVALAENCGSRLQQEIGSKRFSGVLYGLVEGSGVHVNLKKAVVGVIAQLSASFQSDPSLKYMNDVYRNVLKHHGKLLREKEVKEGKVGVEGKVEVDSKTTEEEELAEAMRLSLQEYESVKHESVKQESGQDVPPRFKRVVAMYNLQSNEPDELSFNKGDIIVVLDQVYRDWWRGITHGRIGLFPQNYVRAIDPEEEEEERRGDYGKLLAGKDKVDILHDRLVSSSDRDKLSDDTTSQLYKDVSVMRPELHCSINELSRRRDRLESLQKVLNHAERTYQELICRDRDNNI